MTNKKILMIRGGWEEHDTIDITNRYGRNIWPFGYDFTFTESFDCLKDKEELATYDLIVVAWGEPTEVPKEYIENISYAVSKGTGLGGWHAFCDVFRNNTLWQFMTGGQFVAHPGGDNQTYTVNITDPTDSIVHCMLDFTVKDTEQYYLHVDPSVKVLATTDFPNANGLYASNKPCKMPVVWTKKWGYGRVFYCSVGHNEKVFKENPTIETIVLRGLLWASEGKDALRGAAPDLSKFGL